MELSKMAKHNDPTADDYSVIRQDLNEIINTLFDLLEQLKTLNLDIEFSYSQEDHIVFQDQLKDFYTLRNEIRDYFKKFRVLINGLERKSLERILEEQTELEESIKETFETLKNECENIFQEIESLNQK